MCPNAGCGKRLQSNGWHPHYRRVQCLSGTDLLVQNHYCCRTCEGGQQQQAQQQQQQQQQQEQQGGPMPQQGTNVKGLQKHWTALKLVENLDKAGKLPQAFHAHWRFIVTHKGEDCRAVV